MKKSAVLAALLLAGCSDGNNLFYNTSETVYLAAPNKPDVKCGPYKELGGTGEGPKASLRACVSDFQRQGYQRVAAPSK